MDITDKTSCIKVKVQEALDTEVGDSCYLDITELENWLPENENSNGSSFNFMHHNIRSLFGKQKELHNLLSLIEGENSHIHAIGISESLLKPFIKNTDMQISDYNIFRKDRQIRKGGGVSLLIKKCFKTKEILVPFVEGIFEAIACEITINNKEKIAVAELYRPPNSDMDKFLELFDDLCDKLKSYSKVLIGMDSNLDLIKHETHGKTRTFMENFLKLGYCPLILVPTHITHQTATLIDNVLISSTLLPKASSCVLNVDLSDHLPCFSSIEFETWQKNTRYETRNMSIQNLQKVAEGLKFTNFIDLINDDLNLDTCIDNVTKRIQQEIECYCNFEVKTHKSHKAYTSPWLTESIIRSSKKASNMYGKVKNIPKTDSKYQTYLLYRSILQKLKRKTKRDHLKKILEKHNGNSKAIWTAINIATNKSNNKTDIPHEFKINGKYTSDMKIITNAFCDHFANIANITRSKIKNSKSHFSHYLNNKNNNNFYAFPTNNREIERIIDQLKTKNSHGNDMISNRLIKLLKENLVDCLVYLINRSLNEGYFPKIFCNAIIKPLFKNKCKDDITNYRPISLLRCLSKIFEKVMNNRLASFLEKNDIYDDGQYGFRKKRSTQDAINDFVGTVLDKLNNKETVFAVLIDLSKAFDTCDHDILLAKLDHYGIRGTSNQWIKSFLKNRTISVKIEDEVSKIRDINIGSPQGGVISPTLFCIMINDLRNSLKYSSNIMFADDTTILNSAHGPHVGYARLKYDLNSLSEWFRSNKLLMNASKSQLIVFKPSGLKLKFNTTISMDDENIIETTSANLLGTIIDNKLTWEAHIHGLKNKLSYGIFKLNSVKKDLDTKLKREMYYAFFNSHLVYGISSWGPMISAKLLRSLEVLQNKALRIICNLKTRDSVRQRYKDLKILPLRDLIKLELSKISYKYIDGSLSKRLTSLFEPQKHTHSTRYKMNPTPKSHKMNLYNKSFLAKAPSVWLSLNNDVKQAKSIQSFKNKFKKLIFKN